MEGYMAVETAPLPAITVHSGYMRAKRIIDVVFTLLIFIPLCLVIAVVAVCIRLDSEGPVFFRQKRVGLNGKEFTMIKLRSMYVQSDDTIHREAIQRYMNGETLDGGSYKLKHDPRVTRVGRFIRKTSIDELPQFFNVLRGEMTLVGPRPPLPYEVEEYGSREWLRLASKPGLTGTWQVYGRSQVQFQEMVDMDIDYLQRQSIWLDLKLIFLTPIVMLSGRGGC
jgi:lipopolysaccharide/colanic/teichoic acid biosynthesis glycosyltransferase